MRVIAFLLAASIAFAADAATAPPGSAPDISGAWQGTLHGQLGDFRLVFQVRRDSEGWRAKMYSLDTVADAFPVANVSLTGSTVRLGVYEGMLSADGTSITGKMMTPPGLPLDLVRATRATAWNIYDTAHSSRFVTVEPNVKLEVLDWGGTGRPVILLAGLGNSARVFDKFAPKLTPSYHVYGITRRGFGDSSAPSTGYSVDRLGQDVLAVIDAPKINRPVLIGHSLAGEELSYIGAEYPKKIAGLVHLDAGYGYAFYDKPRPGGVASIPPDIDLYIDADDLQRKLTQILFDTDSQKRITLIDELLNRDLAQVRNGLQAQKVDLLAGGQNLAQVDTTPIQQALLAGMHQFTKIGAPILAIYADPHSGNPVPKGLTKAKAAEDDKASVEAQIVALKRYNPSAQIIRMPDAIHYLYVSNEAEVLKDVHTFIDTLPASSVLK